MQLTVRQLAARFVPQLAFLDIGLPNMSGYDVVRAFASICRQAVLVWCRFPLGSSEGLAKKQRNWIDTHLTKSVSMEMLARQCLT